MVLQTALLAAALLATCSSQAQTAPGTDYGSAAHDAGISGQALTTFSEGARLDFAFIHASHADMASLTTRAIAVNADYQVVADRQGMGLAASEQWVYANGALYTGDGTTWKPTSQSQAGLLQPPRSLLDDLKSFEVTGMGADLEWGGALCHTYAVSCNAEVVWIYAPAWMRELDSNLDLRCKGEIYVGVDDGLPHRIFLRLEGTGRDTGLLKLSVNLDASYSRFNDAELKVTRPAQQAQAPLPGS